jgi:GT2 family glycosyltransferase
MHLLQPRVTVVIPNWNGRRHLPECLAALRAQTFKDFEIVLVDNASSDDGVSWVRNRFPDVQVLQRQDNGGFATAANVGIRACRSEFVALLNNDTAVHERWLASLVKAMDAHPAYDFAAPLMVLYAHPERVNAAGDVYSVTRLAGRNRGFGRSVASFTRPRRVLGACAGAVLYRRSLFDEVGLFDEDFFLMSEDTDFNLRCLIADRRCLFVPDALVRHKFRASIDTAPAWDMTRLAIRNEAMVVAKDLPPALLAVSPAFWLWRFFRQTLPVRPSKWHLVPMLVRQTPRRLEAEVEGIRWGWRKRSDVWRRRRASMQEIMRWLLYGVGEVR